MRLETILPGMLQRFFLKAHEKQHHFLQAHSVEKEEEHRKNNFSFPTTSSSEDTELWLNFRGS